MVTLSDDEVAALKAILVALRAIKVREIDKALVILSKADKSKGDKSKSNRDDRPTCYD